jgi:hypothetical protein
MSATWPAGLPQATEIDGYSETQPSLALRSAMETGPAKLRRRASSGPVRIEGTMLLVAAQTETLVAFWRDTLAGGALAFDWTHPRTGLAVQMRFTAPPELRHEADGGGLWRARLALEIV